MFLTKKHKQKILQARERVVFEPLPASAAERRPIRDRKIVLQFSTHFSRIFLGIRKTKLLFYNNFVEKKLHLSDKNFRVFR